MFFELALLSYGGDSSVQTPSTQRTELPHLLLVAETILETPQIQWFSLQLEDPGSSGILGVGAAAWTCTSLSRKLARRPQLHSSYGRARAKAADQSLYDCRIKTLKCPGF